MQQVAGRLGRRLLLAATQPASPAPRRAPHPATRHAATAASTPASATALSGGSSAPPSLPHHPPALQQHTEAQQQQQQAALAPGPDVFVAYYADHWKVPLPDGHRFPMEKYAATHAALEADASLGQWHLLSPQQQQEQLAQGQQQQQQPHLGWVDLRAASPVSWADVTAVHEEGYVERFRSNHMTESEMRNVGFPWSEQLVGRTFSSCGGTVAATHEVLGGGRAIAGNIAGGTHHAFRARGEGFCIFNDIAVAAHVAMREYGVDSILVLDLDVHQGNGTAALFEDDPRVTTFDMHGDKNYPWKTRMRNTYDIALPDNTGDEEYLGLLRSWLPRLLQQHRPQLIFFQAGVDALKGDSFGRLALSRQGLLARNNLVYGTALEAGVPMVITMGGGYTRPMDASVSCHTDVYRTAAYRLAAWHRHSGGRQGQAAGQRQRVALQ